MHCETRTRNNLLPYLQTLKPGSEIVCASIPIVLRQLNVDKDTVTLEFPSLHPKCKKGHLVTMSVHRFCHYLREYI